MAVAMVKISKQDTNWILKPESNYNNMSRFMSKKVLDISSITPVSSEIELCGYQPSRRVTFNLFKFSFDNLY